MFKFFNDLVTGIDGQTHDLGRWSWLISVVGVLGTVAWNANHGVALDPMQIAQSLAVVATAHGVALFAKKDTEPKA